ncbi:hypothetical protein [Undibacterium danionis]|uniref:Uncharacterized protein n=1 Tax=Undibacterium danionis TaxID=1812100 RepID=A0ABV6IEF5_9BURK
MPLLIRTPDQIFREEAKDIYFIRFFDINKENGFGHGIDEQSPASSEFRQWLKTHLPHVKVERMAPSERSGWIEGYFGDIRVDFSDEDLAKFCAHWEDEKGESNDARLRCFIMGYKAWFAEHGKCIPTRERPTKLRTTTWWDTPIGFIYYQSEADHAPAEPRDVWMHALKLWPELSSLKLDDLLNPDKLTHGVIFKAENDKWMAMFSDAPFSEYHFSRESDLREWFMLPDDAEVYMDTW